MKRDFRQRHALPEDDELRNGRKSGRSAAIGEKCNGGVKNRELDLRSSFNPRYWNRNVGGGRYSFNLAVRDGDNGAIVVVIRDCSAVQPCVNRRINFRRRHDEPNCQRHRRRYAENSFAGATAYLVPAKWHFSFIK